MRVGPLGAEKPAVRLPDLPTGWYIDVSDLTGDFDRAFFAGGGIAAIEPEVRRRARAGVVTRLDKQRVGAPIARPQQIVCVELNYRDLADETGHAVPDRPTFVTRSPDTMIGPHDVVPVPAGTTTLDWAAELGVLIGRQAYQLADVGAAAEVIAGYVCVNDIVGDAQAVTPCGPWLATPDELPHLDRLHVWLTVNGIERQHGSTATMLFDPRTVIHQLSQTVVLEPGDLISTGTPAGSGRSLKPPRHLKAGDVMALGIDSLGFQRQSVVGAP